MYRVLTPDLAHVSLENIDFIVERDHALRGTWSILALRDDAPGTSTILGTFLAVRQARHGGFTVWSTAGGGRLIGHSNNPVSACDVILYRGLDHAQGHPGPG